VGSERVAIAEWLALALATLVVAACWADRTDRICLLPAQHAAEPGAREAPDKTADLIREMLAHD
jgi:hypothetical protein